MKEEKDSLENALAERFRKEELMPSADFFETIYAGSQRSRTIQRRIRFSAMAASIAIVLLFWFVWETNKYDIPQEAEKIPGQGVDSLPQNSPIQAEPSLSQQDTHSRKAIDTPPLEEKQDLAPLPSPSPKKSQSKYLALEQDTWHTLPDGSLIRLKQGSSLAYSRSEGMERMAHLEGEAFFEVRKDQDPFIVLGKNTRIEVVGTAFLVKTQEQGQTDQVWVKEGTVKVSPRQVPQKVATLSMGEKAKIDQQEIQTDLNSINSFSWVEQQLKFNNTPLREVIQDLVHHFEVNIRVENPIILDCPISANFNSPRLDYILSVLDKMADLQHTQDQEGYLILGTGCQ